MNGTEGGVRFHMNISVSSLGFSGPAGFGMSKLAPELGVEIFYEWGGATYWELVLEEVFRDRTGPFSIHAPFQGGKLDLSLVEDEKWLFDYLMQPFDLYHKYGGDGYVVHMNSPYPAEPTDAERVERLKRVEDRLARFNDICKREGVSMLVENLAFSKGATLCRQQDFLSIFEHNPELDCIVDTGHAVLAGIDIYEVQKALGARLKAYHMHDNDGKSDGHKRILTGVIDWKRFGEGAGKYTPDANFVMEYNPDSTTTVRDYMTDADAIRAMLKG